MKSRAIVTAILAMSLATGGPAIAQGSRDHGNRDHQGQRGGQQDRGGDRDRGNNEQRRDERGAGPYHEFQRGQRLPPEYHNRQYVVDDWRGHRLSAPPRGYHWVQTGSDYVLVAITTGIILNLLLNH